MAEETPSALPCVRLFGGAAGVALAPRLLLWLVSWLPLVALTGLSSPAAMSTFLMDAEALARLLIGMPALLLGGTYVDRHLTRGVHDLYQSELLPRSTCDPVARQLSRWGSGWVLRALLLGIVAAALSMTALEDSSFALRGWRQAGEGYSPAGAWYRWISTPAYRYLWLRLVWGLIVWLGVIGLVARLLEPCLLHPDRRGGLGRFVLAHAAFAPLVFGLSSSAAGSLANQLLYRGRTLEDVQLLLIGFIVMIQLPILATPLPLIVPLYREKQRTLERLSKVAVPWARLVAPYLAERLPPPSPNTHDLAAHADLIATYTVIDETSIIPLRKNVVLTLALFTALPMLPVILIGVPLSEILVRVTKLL